MSSPDIADSFQAGKWEFTPEVVEVFDQHVRASVPFYDAIQDAVAEMADWLAPEDGLIVDLGCSTGETLTRIVKRHPERRYRLVGYDESPEMLAAASAKVPDPLRLSCHGGRIERGLKHRDADLTLALFTLQFLPPHQRGEVLRQAHALTRAHGSILIAEKVRVPDARWSEIATEVSWDYKANAGIEDSSVRSKARALRGVLRTNTPEQVAADLTGAGWKAPTCLFRWHQWALFGAFRD